MLEYLEKNSGNVRTVFIRDIDRITRGGSSSYTNIKNSFSKLGIRLVDTLGIIQPEQNTLAHLNFEYEWSKRSPSRLAENIKADIANDEITTILTRTVGQEIRLVQQGYFVRPAPIGYINTKIKDDEGKSKPILARHPKESYWVTEMFKLRANGIMTDKEICAHINSLGFRTRFQNKRDKRTGKILGKIGGKKLTPAMLQKYIQKPIFCGVLVEKWTHYKPVKCAFEGLISIKAFNMANRGKVKLIEEKDGKLDIEYGEIIKRQKENPNYPYRFTVLCPICKKHFKGSASRGRHGAKYPAYHCSRGHYFRVPRDTMHKTIESFVKSIRLEPLALKMFEKVALDILRSKQKQVVNESILAGKNVTNLKERQKILLDKIVSVKSEVVQDKLEKEIEVLEKEINSAADTRNYNEIDEQLIRDYIKAIRNLVEHPEKLINTDNIRIIQEVWKLFFSAIPTYEDIKGGTPDIAVAFRLCDKKKKLKSQLVTQLENEWNRFEKAVNHVQTISQISMNHLVAQMS